MGPAPLNRREFLLLRLDPEDGRIELSCERLLMKYVDAQVDGTTMELFARLTRELAGAREVRLTDTQWLAREDFAGALGRALDAFRQSGGKVT